ncbi:2-succinyl-6-hydroxy-2,4-cyclohexadiene-1-carboxylate synthase [anaerobic digester metagenome]
MNLHVEEMGHENSETILFLHGAGMAGWMWREQVEAFRDYHLLIPDLPEHEKSVDVKPFTIEGAADMIVDLIKTRAKGGKAHLVGISLGAQIILQILSKAPEVVDHSMISGTLVHSTPHTETFLKLLNYLINVYKPVKDTDFFIKANMRTYNMPKTLFNEFRESTYLIKPESLDRILHENMLFQMPMGLNRADVPVLVMAGEKEYKVIKESAQDLMEILPNAIGITAPKLGHVWNMENPDIFNRVLRNWIKDENLPGEVSFIK